MKGGNNISEELEGMNSSLANIARTMPYVVPENYFEQLAGHITKNTHAETHSIPLCEVPYKVPPAYFKALPQRLLALVKRENERIKTTAPKRLFYLSTIQWAAAAVLAFVISFLGYMMFSMNESRPEKMLSSVSRNEIKEYVNHSYGIDADKVMSYTKINDLDVNSKDITQYLNETGWE